MTTKTTSPAGKIPSTDASGNALSREQEVPPGEVPVKQRNPGDQGLNPDQKGPAQPSGSDTTGSA